MNYDKAKYVTGKLVELYPNEKGWRKGYIRDVDDLGFVYEVTQAFDSRELGVYFVSHSKGIEYKEVENEN